MLEGETEDSSSSYSSLFVINAFAPRKKKFRKK
jgi:hypothetical protein